MTIPAPIAVQLYSLREEAEADFPAVLARLGALGYRGVETAGLHGLTPEDVRQRVEAAGMSVASAHITLPLGDDANAILDEAEALGTSLVVVPFLPPKYFEDAAAVSRTAEQLNQGFENVQRRGLSMGYHNHYWEYASRIDGQHAQELLFSLLAPEIFAEVDIYWAQVGGADPVKAVEALGNRVRLLHVKDGPADDPKSDMTAVGGGIVDIPGVVAAGASAEWHIVELDRCATDMFEAVAGSHRYLTGEGLSQGQPV